MKLLSLLTLLISLELIVQAQKIEYNIKNDVHYYSDSTAVPLKSKKVL